MSDDLPVLFGARYSAYTRAALMALAAKNVDHRFETVDIFARDATTAGYSEINPFMRIPSLRHDGFTLYETVAINRYVDEAFAGPPLQPADLRQRARMNQIISMADAYGYRTLVWDIYVESISNPREGLPTDEARVAQAFPRARTYLATLSAMLGDRDYLAGPALSLADCHAAPQFGYLLEAPEGVALLGEFPNLAAWWQRIADSAAWRAVMTES